MNRYLLIACAVLAFACASILSIAKNIKDDRDRLKSNQTALLEKVELYKTESGKHAASVQRLQLKRNELEKSREDLMRAIDDLNIKLKRVQAASSTRAETTLDIKTIVRDSVVYRDTSAVRAQTIKYKDAWIDVEGVVFPDRTASMKIASIDTLIQVIHRVPKRFLFFKFGTKAIRQEIMSTNPHTRIVYSDYIELK